MSKQYPGGLITKTPVVPSGPYQTSTASGIWTLDQQAAYAKLGQWPTAGNVAPPSSVNYLVIAGGGGGGSGTAGTYWYDGGGGGGAGGYRTGASFAIGASFTVTVGAGGTVNQTGGSFGGQGFNSVFSSITSTGGGGAGGYNGRSGIAGGSGGGSGATTAGTGGTGTAGQGNNGGVGTATFEGGGGGGAGAVGTTSGGIGTSNSILPTFSGTGNIASTTVLTVTAITTGSIGPGVLVATATGIPASTYITEQLYGATGTAVANTTLSASASAAGTGSVVQNISVTSATGIAVGHLVAGNGAQVLNNNTPTPSVGIRADTYVTAIVGTTITLSNSILGTINSGTAVYFYAPGGTGAYTMSAAATATTTGIALTSSGQYFAGGGGGVSNSTTATVFFAGGAGGGGGGGNNASATTKLVGQSGGANTGGGAGGSRDANGGTGGSGIVVIRYSDSYPLAASTTGSPTVTTAGGYRVYKYTSSGTITF